MNGTPQPHSPAILLVSAARTWLQVARAALRTLPCTVAFADAAAPAVRLACDADYARVLVDARLPGHAAVLAGLEPARYASRAILLADAANTVSPGLSRLTPLRAVRPRPSTPSALRELVRAELESIDGLLIDPLLVAELRAVVAPAAARAALCAQFSREAVALWDSAEAARSAGRAAACRASLHRLRGAAASMGARALDAALSRLVGSSGAPGDETDWSRCRTLLEATFDALRTALDDG